MTTDKTIKKLITEIVQKIVLEYKPVKIILFGSHAYGRPSKDSDIDLLIIKNTEKGPMERWMELKKVLRDRNRTIPVSPLIYTEKELEDRIVIKDFFIQEIFEKGEVLYG